MKYMHRNSRKYNLLLMLAIALLSAACNRSGDQPPVPLPENGLTTADWLLYEEQEQGTGQYPVRILVSRDFVRFDDNIDAGDFLLLDRRERKLFSVSHEERSILVIESSPGDTDLPADILLAEEREEDSNAPKIAGRFPVHVRFRANDVLCYEAVVIPGMLDRVVEGLTEYAQLLGERQLNSLGTVPVTMRTPCFLSRYAYRPARHLMEGLPVREWDDSGYLRTLMDYGEELEIPNSLFVLPDDYEQFRINQ